MMESLFKGWITSIMGVVIMCCDVVHYIGFFKFPNPEVLSTKSEVIIAFIIGLILFLIPPSKLEAFLESKLEFLLNKLK